MAKELVVKIVNGQWFSTQDGKHLTAQQTAKAIDEGTPYNIVVEKEA